MTEEERDVEISKRREEREKLAKKMAKIAAGNAKLGIINYQDRFFGTPMMDAKREKHPSVYKELHKWNEKIRAQVVTLGGTPLEIRIPDTWANEMLAAANATTEMSDVS